MPLSNVSGSNLANMCVGFGLCALLASAEIRRRDFGTDMLLAWIAPLVVLLLMFTNPQHRLPIGTVIPLTLFLVFYLVSLRSRESSEEGGEMPLKLSVAVASFLAGLVGLSCGGKMVLDSAISAAAQLGVSEDIIGLTIVAFGTSVPDITASVVAARKNEHGIAVGNIVGSNISNLVLVLNSTVLVSLQSLDTAVGTRCDYLAVTLVSLFCWLLAVKQERIGKVAAVCLLCAYCGYLVARVWQVAPGG